MPDGTALAYTYDGSFEGFMTAVFEAYSRKENVRVISSLENFQSGLLFAERHIKTEAGKAARVMRGIEEKLGKKVLDKIYYAYLSDEEGKDTAVYEYIRYGFKVGKKIAYDLADARVNRVEKLSLATAREFGKLRGFLRFAETESGIFFARIAPKHNLLPLLGPHFAGRFPDMPFVIMDEQRFTAFLYDTHAWYLTEVTGPAKVKYSRNELDCQEAWREFYGAASIKERFNPKLRRQMMPKRYWKYMCEMNISEPPREDHPALGGPNNALMKGD